MNLIETRRENVRAGQLEFLAKNAPKLPIAEAYSQAGDVAEYAAEAARLSLALIVLAQELGELDEHGGSKNHEEGSEALKWAMGAASHEHAGWACSPFGGGLEGLKKEIDKVSFKQF